MSVKASVPEVCLDSPGAAYTGVNDKLDAMVGKFEETKRKLERAFSLPTSVGTEVPKQEWSCSVPRIKASNGRTASTPIGIHLFDEQTRHVFGKSTFYTKKTLLKRQNRKGKGRRQS